LRPYWRAARRARSIDKLTADEFVNINHDVAGGRGNASNYYERGK
jgi:hypothetical protein